MLATRRDPFFELTNQFHQEMDRLFNRWGMAAPRPLACNVYPPLNLWQDEDHVYVEAELPGLELNDLEIYVTGGDQLSIQGERKQPQLEKGAWHRLERGYGSFARVLQLPCQVDSDQVAASFRLGVLTITLPKRPEVKPRRIEVKAD